MSKKHNILATCYDKRGREISRGINSYNKSHPIQKMFAEMCGENHRIYLHAEIAALLRCGTIKPARIHIERYLADGTPANAKPCKVCSLAIKKWKVGRVTFTEPVKAS